MAISIAGTPFVCGKSVTLWELRNVLPSGKWYKVRCRPKSVAELFVKDDNGIRQYYIIKHPDGRFELMEMARNERKVVKAGTSAELGAEVRRLGVGG